MTLKYPAMNGRKSLTGRTQYCGPFAVAMLTGMDYDGAYTKLLASIRRQTMESRKRKYKNRPSDLKWSLKQWPLPTRVKGTYDYQIKECLRKLGVKVEWSKAHAKVTVAAFADLHTVVGQTYLVCAGHHWIVLKDGVLYHAHHAPKAARLSNWALKRVTYWAAVRPRPAALECLPLEPMEQAA